MRKLLSLVLLAALAACAPKTYISNTYNFNQVRAIGILPFEYPAEAFSGAENMFSKYLIAQGFKVVERAQIEKVFAEHNLSVNAYLSPDAARKIGKVLGVQALLMGEITSYLPEQKKLTYNVSRTSSSEPVFSTRVATGPGGEAIVNTSYAGQKATHTRDVYPTEYTIYAQVGVVAKLVDVNTAEIIWVGSDTSESVSGLDALDSSAKALIKSFAKKFKKAVKNESK